MFVRVIQLVQVAARLGDTPSVPLDFAVPGLVWSFRCCMCIITCSFFPFEVTITRIVISAINDDVPVLYFDAAVHSSPTAWAFQRALVFSKIIQNARGHYDQTATRPRPRCKAHMTGLFRTTVMHRAQSRSQSVLTANRRQVNECA